MTYSLAKILYCITADLVTFTEKILNGKLHFLCSVRFVFLIGKFLTYPGIKYNNSCFFNLYWEYCPGSSNRPRKLNRYLGYFRLLQLIFPDSD